VVHGFPIDHGQCVCALFLTGPQPGRVGRGVTSIAAWGEPPLLQCTHTHTHTHTLWTPHSGASLRGSKDWGNQGVIQAPYLLKIGHGEEGRKSGNGFTGKHTAVQGQTRGYPWGNT
jgi:hypothetical protein